MILLFRMGDNGEWWNRPPERGVGPGLRLNKNKVLPRPPQTPHPSTLREAAAPPPPPQPQNSSNNEGPVMLRGRPAPREVEENISALRQRRVQKKQEFDALVAENIRLRARLGMSDSNKELEALLTLESNPAGSRVEISNKRMQVFKALKRENEALNEALVKKGRGFTVGNAKRGLLALGAAGLTAGLGSRYLGSREVVETHPSLADPFGSYAGSTLHAAPPPAPVTFSTMLPPGGLEEARAEAQAIEKLKPTPTETPVPPRRGIIQGLLYGKLQGGRKGTKRRRISKRRRSSARRR